ININTMTEPEVFRALCDAHDTSAYPYPWFTQNDVDAPIAVNPNAIFNKIIAARTGIVGATPSMPVASDGSPFQSFSAGNVNDTWFRSDANGKIFDVGAAGTHPYLRASLLQKIFNNITTTSNVFAVWFTAG